MPWANSPSSTGEPRGTGQIGFFKRPNYYSSKKKINMKSFVIKRESVRDFIIAVSYNDSLINSHAGSYSERIDLNLTRVKKENPFELVTGDKVLIQSVVEVPYTFQGISIQVEYEIQEFDDVNYSLKSTGNVIIVEK